MIDIVFVAVAVAVFLWLELLFVRMTIRHALKKLTVDEMVKIFMKMSSEDKAVFRRKVSLAELAITTGGQRT